MNFNRLRKQLALAGWFARAYPKRSAVTVGCLLLAGVLEGIGIAAMLPLVQIVLTRDSGSETALGRAVEHAFDMVGIAPAIGTLLMFIVIMFALKAVLSLYALTQVGYSSARVARDMRMNLIRALMGVRWEYFSRERSGNFTAAMSDEAYRSALACVQICQILAGLIQVAVYFGLALLVSLWTTLGAMTVGLITVVVLARFISMARHSGTAQNRLMRSLNSRLIEGMTAMKAIKAMGQERQLLPLLESEVEGLNVAQRRAILSSQGLRVFQEPILVLATAVGLYFMLGFWLERLEVLFAIGFLFIRTVTRANILQRNYQALVQNEPAFWFMKSLTGAVESAQEILTGKLEPHFVREVRFERVSFQYEENQILKNVSLTIPARKFTAITGPSGAGKTTLADLLIGLLKPTCGEIYIDDIPMHDLDIKQWRHKIGYVPQETVLFHETIYTNVTLGDTSISRKDVEEALRWAEAWEFIGDLPEGLNTVVGERGMKLSGGQRQRIAIARALAQRPDLLILDEATTSLDPRTEAGLCQTLRHLNGTVTILAISHQPAVVEAADLIYKIEDCGLAQSNGRGGSTATLSGHESMQA